MNHINKIKKIIKIVMIVFTVFLVFILLNFGIHLRRVNRFNSQLRTVNNISENTEVLVDIHPRGQLTDTWKKTDSNLGVLFAKIYEANITNCSHTDMKDWSLKIQIQEDCWISNAWNGTIEIHQFVDGNEKTQQLSLQNYQQKDLVVDYYISGQDLMIPLSAGDYIIYHPCEIPGLSEEIVEATDYTSGEVVTGFIFYSEDGSVDFREYELSYKLNKSIWTGNEPKIFLVMLPVWAVTMLISTIVSVLMVAYEKKIVKQSSITIEFIDAIAEFVDSKENHRSGHSKGVAECAKMIAKELGMKKEDSDNVYYAALVHDIGKIQVPDYLMKKTDELTNEERELLNQHTIKGAEMLKKCTSIPIMSDAALYHHERYDGKGYPFGKAREDIPLIGRIVCLADYYILRRSSLLIHNEEAKEKIIEELKQEKGTRFDPVLVDVLIDVIMEKDVQTWELI